MLDTAAKVYLFQGNNLVLPEGTGAAEGTAAVRGVDKALAEAAFGALEYYSPGPGESPEPGGALIPGILLDAGTAIPPGWRLLSVREAAGSGIDAAASGMDATAALFRMYHLLQWRKDSRYCGSCGSPNGDSPVELARLCPRCGRVEYPRISPAIIILVLRDDGRALLAHNKKFKEGLFSLIAGFVEAGESLEAALVREVAEEVNITVKDIRYLASQGWPFPNSLMVGFTARYSGGDVKPDGEEILDAQWFTRESVRNGVPVLPAPGSVSRYIIDRWLAEML